MKKMPEIKISDFGLATRYKDNRKLYLKCGSPGYMAP